MIPVTKAHVQIAAGTDPGKKGKNNEDRYAVSAYLVSEEQPIPAVLAIVADGIGGHRAGEVAAEMAVEKISSEIAASNPVGSDPAYPAEILGRALRSASQVIYQRAASDSAIQGMGTTCACCWIIGDRLYTASLGDSRIYFIHGGDIHQVSTDHTWVQEAIDIGALTPEQARSHPNVHIIRRFLGSSEQPEPDIRLRLDREETSQQAQANQGMKLVPGDQLLLCTDGLTDLVQQDEILTVLEEKKGQPGVSRLIELANQRGGHDNITAVLINVPSSTGLTQRLPVRRRKLPLACLTFGLLLILTVAILVGVWAWGSGERGENNPGGLIQSTQSLTPVPSRTDTPGLFITSTPPLFFTLPAEKERGPGQTLQPSPILRAATLTPWPTNTP